MPSAIALWNLFQGALYMVVGTFLLCYPQFLDVFDGSLASIDYKYAQLASSIVLIIGVIYGLQGLPNVITNTLSKLIGIEQTKQINGTEIVFAVTSITHRLILVPLVIIIILLTFGKNNTAIVIMSIFFITTDVTLAIVTAFIVRKYGKDCIASRSSIQDYSLQGTKSNSEQSA